MNHVNDDNLYAYLDGILTPKEVRLVEKHLSNCSICAEKFQEMESLYPILYGFEEFRIERNLAFDVVASIEADLAFLARLKWGSIIQMVLAFIALVLIVPYISLIPWIEFIFDVPQKATDLIQDGLVQFVDQWSFWPAIIQEKWPDSIHLTIDIQFSQLPVWPLVIIAMFMCFVGNGLVLSKLDVNGNRG